MKKKKLPIIRCNKRRNEKLLKTVSTQRVRTKTTIFGQFKKKNINDNKESISLESWNKKATI